MQYISAFSVDLEVRVSCSALHTIHISTYFEFWNSVFIYCLTKMVSMYRKLNNKVWVIKAFLIYWLFQSPHCRLLANFKTWLLLAEHQVLTLISNRRCTSRSFRVSQCKQSWNDVKHTAEEYGSFIVVKPKKFKSVLRISSTFFISKTNTNWCVHRARCKNNANQLICLESVVQNPVVSKCGKKSTAAHSHGFPLSSSQGAEVTLESDL